MSCLLCNLFLSALTKLVLTPKYTYVISFSIDLCVSGYRLSHLCYLLNFLNIGFDVESTINKLVRQFLLTYFLDNYVYIDVQKLKNIFPTHTIVHKRQYSFLLLIWSVLAISLVHLHQYFWDDIFFFGKTKSLKKSKCWGFGIRIVPVVCL